MENIDNSKKFTQSGESNIPQEVRSTSDFLPYVINTTTNKKFLESTFDQLMSSGTTEPIDYYWGRINGTTFDPVNDVYNYEKSTIRQNYQFAPGYNYSLNNSSEALSYANVISNLSNLGYDISDLDKLYSNVGYTLDLPINLDMFINYINYYWIESEFPVCVIEPTVQNPINIDLIQNYSNYTTPVLSNGKTLTFFNGMRVKFIGDNIVTTLGICDDNAVYIVNGVGESITLTKEITEYGKNIRPSVSAYSLLTPTQFGDLVWDETVYDSTTLITQKEYVVINSASTDANPWSRLNRWLSIYAITEICNYNDLQLSDILTTAGKATRPIIEFNSNIELYNSGKRLISVVDHLVDCNNTIFPGSDIIGQTEYFCNGKKLKSGELIAFTNCNELYFGTVYIISFAEDNTIRLRECVCNFGDYDKILILNSNVSKYVGNELYWKNNDWVYGQQKLSKGSAPLFELYTDENVALSSLENSNFYGSNIFSYVISDTTVFDRELGFNAKTNSLSSDEFMFQVDSKVYTTTENSLDFNPIEGFFYYKDTLSTRISTLWKQIKNTQRVPAISTIVVENSSTSVQFNLGTGYGRSTQLAVSIENNNYKFYTYDKTGLSLLGASNDVQLLKSNTEYTIRSLISDPLDYLQFFTPTEEISPRITANYSGPLLRLTISSDYEYNTIIYRNTSGTITGKIYVVHDNADSIVLLKNGIRLSENIEYVINNNIITVTTQNNVGDIFELSWIAGDASGVTHDVAPIFSKNSLNEEIAQINYSNLLNHFQDQIVSIPGFSGTPYGRNNYNQLPKIHNYGGTIRQQIYSPVIHSVLSNDSVLEPLSSIRENALDYANFKSYFKSKVLQLWNTGDWDNIAELVDTALTDINIGKGPQFKYAYSDMVYYGSEFAEARTYNISDAQTSFAIASELHNFGYNTVPTYAWIGEVNNSIYEWKLLQRGVDYTISGKTLNLLYSPYYTPEFPAILNIKQYIQDSYSFVPFSTVKLGLQKPTRVYIENNNLFGHDGSITPLTSENIFTINAVNFDVVGAALYELENRIYNNLTEKHNAVDNIDNYIPKIQIFGSPLDYKTFKNKVVEEFNYWNNIFDYGSKTTELFDANNRFTWNYSSVGTGIAGWRGIYLYNFGTYKPHIAPWEMLGHKSKPSWWDTYYSWTDLPKRDALINSLKFGITENPSLPTSFPNPEYAIAHYDWDNFAIVDLAGLLVNPVDANVVAAPTLLSASTPFSYGDFMFEDEVKWLESSEYNFTIALVAMKLAPVKVFEKYMILGGIVKKEADYYDNPQLVYNNTGKRGLPKTRDIHKSIDTNSGIYSINIKNGGSNYSQNAKIYAPVSPNGTATAATLNIVNGIIRGVTIVDPASGYRSNIYFTVVDETGSGAVIEGLVTSTPHVNIVPGLLASIIETNSEYNSYDDFYELLNSFKVSSVVHLGGYSRTQNIEILLDGSYKKGPVAIPNEDYTISLTKNPYTKSIFYSGVRIEKTNTNGYRVYGYNVINPKFTYMKANENGVATTETIGTFNISKYLKYSGTTEIPYGYEFNKRQDLYNFIVGLGEYYKLQGFEVNWNSSATNVIRWSVDSAVRDDLYENGVFENKLVYNQGNFGVVDQFNVDKSRNTKIINKDGSYVENKNLIIIRNQSNTEIQKKDGVFDIYGLLITIAEYEHLISINQVSQFGDIIYDSKMGIGQPRIRIRGERTRNWNGRIEANGYLVSENSILGNYETSVREIEKDVVNAQGRPLDRTVSKTSRFNVGYIEPSYLKNSDMTDNAAYQFSIGERKYKGTTTALQAFLRNNKLFLKDIPEYSINENWLIRLGDYGDKRKRNPIQIELDKSLIKTNPQLIRFNTVPQTDRLDDNIIDVSNKDINYVSGDFSNMVSLLPIKKNVVDSLEQSTTFGKHNKTSGLPLITDAQYYFNSIDDMFGAYDPDAPYATVPTWNSSTVYRQGDQVRLNGKVYELVVNSTGINFSIGELSARGNVILPTVPSGSTLILGTEQDNLQTITFSKISQQSTYQDIQVTGNKANPISQSGKTLIIDGITVPLQKTITTNIFEPIVVDGTVPNPIIVGNSGASLAIDGVAIDFTRQATQTVSLLAGAALSSAFEDAGITPVASANFATQRLNALEALRLIYVNPASPEPTRDWEDFINTYYSGTYLYAGLNINFLKSEITAKPLFATRLQALLDHDIALINDLIDADPLYTDETITTLAINSAIALINDLPNIIIFSNFIREYRGSILPSTVISTSTELVAYRWNLDDIVAHINAALVQAGKSANTRVYKTTGVPRLRIEKIAVQGNNRLVIGSGTANSSVGITTQTYTSNSIISTTGSVTLLEAVQLINLAKIPNVVANISSTIQGNVLKIISNNPTLVIGGGTANTDFGLIVESIVANSGQQSIVSDLNIYDIINQINNSAIPFITASNINNFVVITANAAQFYISGDGTANPYLGIGEIDQSTDETVDNEFLLTEWVQIPDPAQLKIWVQDNIGKNVVTNKLYGYNLYQAFDFDFNIIKICAGIKSGDDAMVTIDGVHNLSENDYVMILNSDCLPEIDGIHRVTQIMDTDSFMIDGYIDSEGENGKLIILNQTRFASSDDLFDTLSDPTYFVDGKGWKSGMLAYVDTITGDSDGRGGVYICVPNYQNNTVSFVIHRYQNRKVRNDEIKNAIIFNDAAKSLTQLEVFDPAKGIIPGFADAEIDIKSVYDIAIYNSTTDLNSVVDESNYWSANQVGKVWWDVSNAIYVDYEQSTIEYRQSQWGKLYPTGSIDIYEWTRSPVAPDEYISAATTQTIIDGIQITGEPYFKITQYNDIVYYWTEEIEFDPKSGGDKTYYYFWVKNKTNVPTTSRNYTTTQLAQIVLDPTSAGVNWIAFCDLNTVLIGNIDNCVNCEGSILQINYRNDNTSYHQEFGIYGERDAATSIPEWLHMGLRDSIAGEDSSIYYYDYVNWVVSTAYAAGTVVVYNNKIYMSMVNGNLSRFPNTSPSVWKLLNSAAIVYNKSMQKNMVEASAPRKVPNIWLHDMTKYGIEILPRQSWIRDVREARRIMVGILNDQMKTINITNDVNAWDSVLSSVITVDNVNYDIKNYWKLIDWFNPTVYDPTKAINTTVNTIANLSSITSPTDGYIVKVRRVDVYDGNVNYGIYQYINGGWNLIYKQRGTIQFIDTLWNSNVSGAGWDVTGWDLVSWDIVPAKVLKAILDTLYNDIFTGSKKIFYTDFWFGMLKYIFSEQNNVDWAVKSTLVDFVVSYAISMQKSYTPDYGDLLINYFDAIKPFHTKLRNFMIKRTIDEDFIATISEGERYSNITMKYNRHIGKRFTELSLVGGNSWQSSDNTDYSKFITDELEYEYLYNANSFDQPVYEGWASELYPVKASDAVRITITRNNTSSIEDENSIYPIIFSDLYGKLEYAKPTANDLTALVNSIAPTDTTIEVVDISRLFNTETTLSASTRGIIWINGERIVYRNIQGNKLLNCIRGTKGSVAKPHNAGDIIYPFTRDFVAVTTPDFGVKYYRWDMNEWSSVNWDKSPSVYLNIVAVPEIDGIPTISVS